MCAIEAQLESMLGQFHCEMKGKQFICNISPFDDVYYVEGLPFVIHGPIRSR